MTTTTVRVRTSGASTDFVAFVDLDAGEVRVRFTRSGTRNQWRCDACGSHRFSTCIHEVAARKAWQSINEGNPS